MGTLYLLLLLSQNGAGDINASFVNSESLARCEQSMLLVQRIFTSRDIPLLYRGCMLSPLRFTPFSHSDTSAVTRHHYLISTDGDRFSVEPAANRAECMEKRVQRQGEGVYCATSTQQLRKQRTE